MELRRGITSIAFIVLLAALVIVAIVSMPNIFAITETQPAPMNASIQQVISFELSGNLSLGIFFTNTTTRHVQYAITQMDAWNNATENYGDDTNYGTMYWVHTFNSNTAPTKICHCVCNNLTCSAGDCQEGVDYMYIYVPSEPDSEGVRWANATSATGVPDSPQYSFPAPGTLVYQVVNASMPEYKDAYIYLRYWLNPYPDTITSGTYNTTYKFKIVEASLDCGTCTC